MVVVGLGCAGAAATIEAAEAGADVLVLEAAPLGGGTSAMSGGLIYLGGGTPIQEACGYTDTPEDMARFLLAACGPDADPAKVQAYCEGSVAHYHWLVDHGVPFTARFHPEPSREPPDDSGLVFSGGEDSWPFTDIASPVPAATTPATPTARAGSSCNGSSPRSRPPAPASSPTPSPSGWWSTATGWWVSRPRSTVRRRSSAASRRGAHRRWVRVQPRHGRRALPGGAAVQRPDRDPARRRARHPDGAGCRRGDRWHGPGGGRHPADPAPEPGARHPRQRPGPALHERGHVQRAARSGVPAASGRAGVLRARRRDVHRERGGVQAEVGRGVGRRARGGDRPAIRLPHRHARPLQPRRRRGPRHRAPQGRRGLRPLEPPYGVVDLRVEKSYYVPFRLGGLATTVDSEVLDGSGVAIPGLFAAGRTTAGIRRGVTSAGSRSATARSSGGGPVGRRHAPRPDPAPAARSAGVRGVGRPRRPRGGWPRRA